MKLTTLQDLLVHDLQDLHSAEQQLTEALPRMAKAAKTDELRKAIETHLKETHSQLERVQGLLERVSAKPGRTKCPGMAGIIKEGSDLLDEEGDDSVKDAAIIGNVQRVEHYEIAAYGTARTFAERLGMDDIAAVLEEILKEEKATDQKLTMISKRVNEDAEEADDQGGQRGEGGASERGKHGGGGSGGGGSKSRTRR